MNIYIFARKVCTEQRFDVSTKGLERLVGTLRVAGFSDDIAETDEAVAQTILLNKFHKIASPIKRTAAAEKSINTTAQFEEIESFRSKSLCPRCKKNMEGVKLANYEKANYCPACKVALWAD